jgi:hypothetical protein
LSDLRGAPRWPRPPPPRPVASSSHRSPSSTSTTFFGFAAAASVAFAAGWPGAVDLPVAGSNHTFALPS